MLKKPSLYVQQFVYFLLQLLYHMLIQKLKLYHQKVYWLMKLQGREFITKFLVERLPMKKPY